MVTSVRFAARAAAVLVAAAVASLPLAAPSAATGAEPSLRKRLDALRRPGDVLPTREGEATAMGVAMVAALFAKDCGFIARHVAFPAHMDSTLARQAADVVPPDLCSPDAGQADPLAVLAGEGLEVKKAEAVPYMVWVQNGGGLGPKRGIEYGAKVTAAAPRADDLVVTVTFSRGGSEERSFILVTGAPGALKVRGYWD